MLSEYDFCDEEPYNEIFRNILSGLAIKYQINLLIKNKLIYHFIKHPSQIITDLHKVLEDASAITNMSNPSIAAITVAIVQDASLIEYISDAKIKIPESIQLLAIKNDPMLIRFIENPSQYVQLLAVSANGMALKYIKVVSEPVMMVAVQQNGNALQYIHETDRTFGIKIEAIRQNGLSIRFIDKQDESIQLQAVQQDPEAIRYIIEKNTIVSELVKLAAVQQNGLVVRFIENPSNNVQLAAVRSNIDAILHIHEPNEEVLHECVFMRNKW